MSVNLHDDSYHQSQLNSPRQFVFSTSRTKYSVNINDTSDKEEHLIAPYTGNCPLSSSSSPNHTVSTLSTLKSTQGNPVLSTLSLRTISNTVDFNKKLRHEDRKLNVHQVIQPPSLPRYKGLSDSVVGVIVAATNPYESALDVPLRLCTPDFIHSPPLVDPKSSSPLPTRLAILLKGTISKSEPWDGEVTGTQRDFAKLQILKDTKLRVETAHRAGDLTKEATALVVLGSLYYNSRNLEGTINAFSKAVKIFEMTGYLPEVAFCHNILGVCFYHSEEYDKSLIHHKKMELVCGSYGKCVALINIGISYTAQGEYQFSEQAFTDAIGYAMSCGEEIESPTHPNFPPSAEERASTRTLIALSQGNMGLCKMRLGKLRDSQTAIDKCLEICSQAGDRVGAVVCLLLLGEVFSSNKDYRNALFYFEHAYDIAEKDSKCCDLASIARVSVGVCRGTVKDHELLLKSAKDMGKAVSIRDVLNTLDIGDGVQ